MTDPKTPLDGFFEAARAQPPAPSSDLMARVHGDALAQIERNTRSAPPARSLGQRVMALWPVWSGCVPAALTGIWLGMNPPDLLPDPMLWLDPTSDQVTELSTGFDDWAFDVDEEGQL